MVHVFKALKILQPVVMSGLRRVWIVVLSYIFKSCSCPCFVILSSLPQNRKVLNFSNNCSPLGAFTNPKHAFHLIRKSHPLWVQGLGNGCYLYAEEKCPTSQQIEPQTWTCCLEKSKGWVLASRALVRSAQTALLNVP